MWRACEMVGTPPHLPSPSLPGARQVPRAPSLVGGPGRRNQPWRPCWVSGVGSAVRTKERHLCQFWGCLSPSFPGKGDLVLELGVRGAPGTWAARLVTTSSCAGSVACGWSRAGLDVGRKVRDPVRGRAPEPLRGVSFLARDFPKGRDGCWPALLAERWHFFS